MKTKTMSNPKDKELSTRRWVARHILEHRSGHWEGCLVCVAYNWGNIEAGSAESIVELQQLAGQIKAKGVDNV